MPDTLTLKDRLARSFAAHLTRRGQQLSDKGAGDDELIEIMVAIGKTGSPNVGDVICAFAGTLLEQAPDIDAAATTISGKWESHLSRELDYLANRGRFDEADGLLTKYGHLLADGRQAILATNIARQRIASLCQRKLWSDAIAAGKDAVRKFPADDQIAIAYTAAIEGQAIELSGKGEWASAASVFDAALADIAS